MNTRLFVTLVLAVLSTSSILAGQASASVYTPGRSGVSEVGASAYSINIVVPPGTAGMQPQLTLSYNSTTGRETVDAGFSRPRSSDEGRGPVGVGFSLSGLSALSRCPGTKATDGSSGSVNLDANDKFCLDGQRLVKTGAGVYGAEGTEYRTEAESFSKVISNGVAGAGPAWFKVWTKGGHIMEYGNTADSRIEATGVASARIWALNRVSDRSGNYYTLSYNEDALTGHYSIARIDYTGNTAAGLQPYNSIRFVYEAAPDPATYYVGTSLIQVTQRLAKVQTWAATTLVRDYRLAYNVSPSTARSRVATITECAGDGACLLPTSFTWRDGGAGLTQTGATTVVAGQTSDPVVNILKGDFNGDGFTDVFTQTTTGAKLCYGPALTSCDLRTLPAGSQTFVGDFYGRAASDILIKLPDGQIKICAGATGNSSNDLTTCAQSITGYFPSWRVFVGDFNGDGKTDMYLMNSGGAGYFCDIFLANVQQSCTVPNINNAGAMEGYVADFDGDGRADILFTGSGKSLFCPGKSLYDIAASCQTLANTAAWQSTYNIFTGDFNGDGKSDLLLAGSSGALYCPGPGIASANNCTPISATDFKTATRGFVGDYNGDGIADIMLVSSTGAKFCPGPKLMAGANCVQSSTANWSGATIVSGDFSGDATNDLYLILNQQGLIAAGGNGVADLLAAATNGLGAVTSFTYRPLTDSTVYHNNNVLVSDGTSTFINRPIHVVSQSCSSDGIGGQACTRHFYSSAQWNFQGRGFLGFRYTQQTDPLGRLDITYRSQSFPNIGRTTASYTVSLGQPRNVSMTYGTINTYGGGFASVLTGKTEYFTGLNNVYKSERTAYVYDPYGLGNVETETVYTDETNDALRRATNYSYGNYDIANWVLGQVTSKTERTYYENGALQARGSNYNYVPGTWLLQSEAVTSGSVSQMVTKAYTRDAFGNVTSTTVSGQDIITRTASTAYDAQGRFALTTTNALGHVTTAVYDARFGLATSAADANNISTSWTYDSFGRKTAELRPDGTQSIFAYVPCGGCMTPSANSVLGYYVTSATTGNSLPTYVYFDLLDRHVKTTTRNFANTDWVHADVVQFDSQGRVTRAYPPYFRGTVNRPYTAFTYDALNRVTSATAADGGITTYTYSSGEVRPLWKKVKNALNQETTTNFNYRGQVVSVVDAQNTTMSFTYDMWGNQATVTDAASNQTSYTYDLLGRKTGSIDPDLGTWSYTYDVLGQMLSQTDAKNQTTTFAYDKLGRKTSQSVGGFTSTWAYDTGLKGVGKLSSETANNGVSNGYVYDALGRLSSRSQIVDGVAYPMTRTYDSIGRQATLTYPNGFAVAYGYTALNRLSVIRNAATNALIWRLDAANEVGATDESYGNNTGITRDYDSQTQRRKRIMHARDTDNSLLQQWDYNYDLNGNVTKRKEAFGLVEENYAYDTLNRLTSANLVNAAQLKGYAFDAIGNFTQKTDVRPWSLTGNAYQYLGGKPHAVSQVSGSYLANPEYFYYDANGASYNWSGKNISYTGFNMPSQISSGASNYAWTYDANYSRAKYVTPAKTVIYLREGGPTLYQKITKSDGTVQHRNLIAIGKRLVAQVTTTVIGGNSTTQTHYLHGDALNSITLVTDQNAQVVERFFYDAYGKRRQSNGLDAPAGALTSQVVDFGFTGHEQLDDLKLVHMNGRIYDAYLGRFISADPYYQDAGNAQSFNRYSYVLNNPLRYTDPSGFEDEDGGGGEGEGDDVPIQITGTRIREKPEALPPPPPPLIVGEPYGPTRDLTAGGPSALNLGTLATAQIIPKPIPKPVDPCPPLQAARNNLLQQPNAAIHEYGAFLYRDRFGIPGHTGMMTSGLPNRVTFSGSAPDGGMLYGDIHNHPNRGQFRDFYPSNFPDMDAYGRRGPGWVGALVQPNGGIFYVVTGGPNNLQETGTCKRARS